MKRGVAIGILALLAGCASPVVDETTPVRTSDEPGEMSVAQAEEIRYYVGKLPDRDYVDTYGGAEHPRTWYTAAEALGEIGKPAIPALVERLVSEDAYELKLALYALMLASQDPQVQAGTGGDYLRLGTVLSKASNAENRELALAWWHRYRYLWEVNRH